MQLGQLSLLNDIVFEGNPLEFPHKAALNLGKGFVLKYIRRFIKAKETGTLDLTKAGLSEIPPEIGFAGKHLTTLIADDVLPQAGMKLPFELGACINLKVASFHPQLKIVSPDEAVVKQGIEVWSRTILCPRCLLAPNPHDNFIARLISQLPQFALKACEHDSSEAHFHGWVSDTSRCSRAAHAWACVHVEGVRCAKGMLCGVCRAGGVLG